jgi:uncharacterized protein YutE (UPF0331/DUF86 family)
MVDAELISRKISHLLNYISELEKADDITWEKYAHDARARAFVERYLHLAIEEMFDIANHFVSFNSWREPAGYRDLFLILNERGLIPDEQLLTFQNMASFRNLLVHRYEKMDDEVVYGIFKKRLPDFHHFVDMVEEWIKTHPNKLNEK